MNRGEPLPLSPTYENKDAIPITPTPNVTDTSAGESGAFLEKSLGVPIEQDGPRRSSRLRRPVDRLNL